MSTFSRRGYEAIARVINDALYQHIHNAEPFAEGIIMGLALMFKDDNERFDGERFIEACSGDEIPSLDVKALMDGFDAFMLEREEEKRAASAPFTAGGVPTSHYDMSDQQADEFRSESRGRR